MRVEDTFGVGVQGTGGQERSGQCPAALSFLELFFRSILSRLRHTSGMEKASLQFHIQQNDYFGTLATVLDLVRQDLDRRGYHSHAVILSGLREELIYLRQSHQIEKIQDSEPKTRVRR